MPRSICPCASPWSRRLRLRPQRPPSRRTSTRRSYGSRDGGRHRQAPGGVAEHRHMNGGTRHTETPGYTASVASCARRWRRPAGTSRSRSSTCLSWRENEAPVFQQLTPTPRHTFPVARRTTTPRRSTTSRWSSRRPPRFRMRRSCRRTTSRSRAPGDRRVAARRTTTRTRRTGAISLIQRGTCGFAQKLETGRGGGRGRRDPLQRG